MAVDVRENIRTVAAVWRDARTGSLLCLAQGDEEAFPIDLVQGGLCRPKEVSRLARAIARNTVVFEPGSRRGGGDRRVMGKLLLAVGKAVAERTGGTISPQLVVQLVVPVARVADVLDPKLLERLAARPTDIGELTRDGIATMGELRALAWIGVIRTARSRTPRAREPEVSSAGPESAPIVACQPTPEGYTTVSPSHLIQGAAFGVDQDIDELPDLSRPMSSSAESTIEEEALRSVVEEELGDQDLSSDEVQRLLAVGGRVDEAPPGRESPPPPRVIGKGFFATDHRLDGRELGPLVRQLVVRGAGAGADG